MTSAKTCLPIFFCLLMCTSLKAQDTSRLDRILTFPGKIFQRLDKKNAFIENKLARQTERYLSKLQKRENRLRRKLWKKDSTLAKQLFDGVDEKYSQLKNNTGYTLKNQNAYSGHLDSLTTVLNFLKLQSPATLQGGNIQKSLAGYQAVQERFNQSTQVKIFVLQRQQKLKQQFDQSGMGISVKKFRKDVYYYQQEVQEYKNLFQHPRKAETKILELVLKHTKFKDFFAKNSVLGSLFGLPTASSPSSASFQGLQTRATANQTLINSFGSAANVNAQLQRSVQDARPSTGGLTNRLRVPGSGSFGNAGGEDIPGFKPNSQKTKNFFQRLEFGANVQSQKARYLFPVTTDVALSAGYRINDKSSIGIGVSYKIGWGSSWSRIRMTQQGIGLRSYLEWKLKGSFYISGGYEQNYRTVIRSIQQLQDYSAWQSSGLIGVSRKYSIGKKMKGDMKLLWDFMSYGQIPRAQPILFRVGYNFK